MHKPFNLRRKAEVLIVLTAVFSELQEAWRVHKTQRWCFQGGVGTLVFGVVFWFGVVFQVLTDLKLLEVLQLSVCDHLPQKW